MININFKKNSILWKINLFFLCIGIITLIYAHYEYTNIQVKHITLESKDIPISFNGTKVLFLADFQVDTLNRYNKKQMYRIAELVNKQEKDIILMGGDYVNWTGKIDRFYNDLKNIENPKYGTYVILGNHDYVETERTIGKLKELNYKILRNENEKITLNNENIYIAGTEDLWMGTPDANIALKGIEKEDFVFMLTHNPDYFEEMTKEEKEKCDITLSGHVHGGQITFFGKIIHAPIKYKEKYGYGLKVYEENKIYITSGVGGSAFEMFIRFFAKPEIVIFTLKRI